MKNRSLTTSLSSVALIALGFVAGTVYSPQESKAQSGKIGSSEHFVVIAGYTGSTSGNPDYFVVRPDGSAARVQVDGKSVAAPNSESSGKIELKHKFDKSYNDLDLDLDHSGRIGK